MISSLSILALTGLFVGLEDNAVAQEAAKMEGVWRFDSIEVDGAARPQPPFESNKVIMLKDGRFVIMQGKSVTHGVLKADPTKNPKQYDSTIMRGPAKGMTFPCIYELSADTYKLCGPYRPGERPKEFVTKPGSGLVMQVLKREKQSVAEATSEAARKELEGRWQGTSSVRDGKPESEDAAKKMKLTFDLGGNTTEVGPGGLSVTAVTKINAIIDPMAIDFVYSNGPGWRGFAQVDGESLTICSVAPGIKERPIELSSKPGSGLTCTMYQREAAEKN